MPSYIRAQDIGDIVNSYLSKHNNETSFWDEISPENWKNIVAKFNAACNSNKTYRVFTGTLHNQEK